MKRRGYERRRQNHELRPKPPPSPVNAIVLMVVGALGVFAAAAAVVGSGYDNVTPHGQLLGDLSRVAEAQEQHHRESGTFAEWTQTLDFTPTQGVKVTILEGNARAWEALADHQMGLSCMQSGTADGGVIVRDEAVCFTPSR